MSDPVPPAALDAAVALSREARRRVLAALRKLRGSPRDLRHRVLPLVRAELARVEPLLARTLRDAQLLAWLRAGREAVRELRLPPMSERRPEGHGQKPGLNPTEFRPDRTQVPDRQRPTFRDRLTPAATFRVAGPPEPPLPPALIPDRPGDPPPVVRFPQVERAARYLATRLDYTPDEYATLDDQARAVAFTVSKAASLDAVEKVRKALVEQVAEGGTLKQFRGVVDDALGAGAMSPAAVETLYRTQIGRAYAAGQQDVLAHPLVEDEFPYLEYSATHDARVRPDHLAMERLGLDGTAVYRRDDPIWTKYYPPWAYNCRCIVIPLTLEDAAERGVREAIRWLRTGTPPARPQWVADPGFPLPKGWVPVGKRLVAAV